jgi:hypothetical protein
MIQEFEEDVLVQDAPILVHGVDQDAHILAHGDRGVVIEEKPEEVDRGVDVSVLLLF